MHEELKQTTGNNGGFDENLRTEIERVQRENNLLHQQMISVKEKFMSFKIGNLKFIDSFQFVTSSLEKLVDSLKLSGEDIYKHVHIMKNDFKDESTSENTRVKSLRL